MDDTLRKCNGNYFEIILYILSNCGVFFGGGMEGDRVRCMVFLHNIFHLFFFYSYGTLSKVSPVYVSDLDVEVLHVLVIQL